MKNDIKTIKKNALAEMAEMAKLLPLMPLLPMQKIIKLYRFKGIYLHMSKKSSNFATQNWE